MRVHFKDLSIGDRFHTGKSMGAGIHSNVEMWQEYLKTSKSEAVCDAQIGYGNTRQVGHAQKFSAFATVYTLDDDFDIEEFDEIAFVLQLGARRK